MKDVVEDLQKEVETLKAANSAKTELISISSHQLRTSLSAIKWVLKMFLDGDYGKLTDEQLSMLKKASESNDRMVELVNDVLNLNHIDSMEANYKFEPSQLANLAQEVVYEFDGESKKKEITLTLEKADGLPLVNIDVEKIRVVVQNLVENALKYTGKGGSVHVSVKVENNMVKVMVADSGIGIPDDSENHIFEKFYRARNAEEKDHMGSGLGLYTSKNIVARHSGVLSFSKNPTGGTIFWFTIPIH